jgi:starch phosphorylase
MFGSLLPRHLEIIFEINRRFLEELRMEYPRDDLRLSRMPPIDEKGTRYVQMARLASGGSHAINGVAELHSELLKRDVVRDFHEYMPEKFTNASNGVTPRRFMVVSNPKLSRLISGRIGEDWIRNLQEIRGLESSVDDPDFQKEWRRIKRENNRIAPFGCIAANFEHSGVAHDWSTGSTGLRGSMKTPLTPVDASPAPSRVCAHD